MNSKSTLAALALFLSACGSEPEPHQQSGSGEVSGSDYVSDDAAVADSQALDGDAAAERQPFDEDAARERAEEEVASEGYSGPCTQDCSGHNAGFAWAAEGYPDEGTSSSQSFDEGQQAYEEAVEERVDEYQQAHDDGEEPDD